MSAPATTTRRLVLVPAASRAGDAQLRRYRLTKRRIEAPTPAASPPREPVARPAAG